MSERLTQTELCNLLAGLMENRVLAETTPPRGRCAANRPWEQTIEYVEQLADEQGHTPIQMLAHLVYLGLAVDSLPPDSVSRIVGEIQGHHCGRTAN